MDWSNTIIMVSSLIETCFPYALIFGVTAKIINFALEMIFNKKITI